MKRLLFLGLIVLILFCGVKVMAGEIKLNSSAFKKGEMIPKKYTCDGKDISPPLSWEDIPEEANTLAIVCDDPDAPMGIWVHWVIFNIPPTERGLPENIPPEKILKNGAIQGKTDFGRIGYGGPCPPGGIHRYFFKIYALDKKIPLKPGATKKELLKAMEEHILAEGKLIGKYGR
ncbi:MAG: YbhB/YbcL family Raf kinase inhibitor-like protein [Deltaproteobacteria bacterium]|nr:YbhB/YbcL family Raf kinase inhibitor-like protein [Deltaproteobacteria bacterium]